MTQDKPKIALVTGASRGLGKNTALAVAKKGVGVIVTYLNGEVEAKSVVSEIEAMGNKAVALQLDIGSIETLDAFVLQVKQALQNTWGIEQFDFLINNAGVSGGSLFTETTEEEFDRIFNVNFKGVFFLTQKLLPLLKDGGRIVNFSSFLTRTISPGRAIYASMKGAIEVLTRSLAKELGQRQITVNVVAPGAIATEGSVVRDNPEINKYITSQTALGRVGEPDDIGGAIALLLSEENRWITGQRIEVSGGQSL
ncbi:SDR family oxidoreductase [Nodosilinea sp. LEGE 07088]|uniref:SDR family NAD(P)-dependent oxidoreductase n=1 Tax=Nodosilinea sp. LEGE 07088 TaxID=2777968 RepID=UPI00187EFA3D|nr:SDR family oxidoreductase [Nodosilinea sp. LEGE 07088]MBE9136468.1 SDR family oxidoreductase [Nodosilinea sp. LEGE 07088]